jgi:hypothetical protein
MEFVNSKFLNAVLEGEYNCIGKITVLKKGKSL